MKTSPNGRRLIEQFEGCILQAYDDANDHVVPVGGKPVGTLTIGYGHTNGAGAPQVTPGMVITKTQADSILSTDLKKYEDEVNKLVKVPLSQNQFDALVSFQMNTGSLAKSSVLTSLNKKDYDDAANRLMLYTNVRHEGQLVPSAGLIKRRSLEKKLFLKPDTSAAGPVAGLAAAGGAAVIASPHHWWPWIIAGTLAAIIVTFIGYTVYEYNQSLKVHTA